MSGCGLTSGTTSRPTHAIPPTSTSWPVWTSQATPVAQWAIIRSPGTRSMLAAGPGTPLAATPESPTPSRCSASTCWVDSSTPRVAPTRSRFASPDRGPSIVNQRSGSSGRRPRYLAGLRRVVAIGGAAALQKHLDEVNGQRKDNGAVLFGGDLSQRLQVPQLQRCRLTVDHLSGGRELLACAELPFRVDDFGALLPLGFGLLSHRPLHRLGELDVAHFDARHLDPPAARLLVDDFLEPLIDLVALAQQMVQVRLAENAAQRRLSDQ